MPTATQRITPADLAPLLGGMPGTLYIGQDFFNIDDFKNGMVSLNKSLSQNISGTCPQTDMRGTLISQAKKSQTNALFGIQIFVSFDSNIYIRNCWSNDWLSWIKIS
jgi:hypothetical protein